MMDQLYDLELPLEITSLPIEEKEQYLRKIRTDVVELRETLEKMRNEAPNRIMQEKFSNKVTPYNPGARFAVKRTLRSPDKKKLMAMAAYKPTDHIEVATVSQNGIVVLWDAATGLKYDAMNIGKGNTFSVDVSENGSVLAAGGLSCIVEIYSVGDELRRATGHTDLTTLPPNDGANNWSFLNRPDQHRIGFGQHGAPVTATKFIDDVKLASGAENGTLFVFDIKTEHPIDDQQFSGPISCVDKHLGTDIICVGTVGGDISVMDMRVESDLAQTISTKDEEIKAVKFLPDGYSVLSTRSHGLMLYDLRSSGILQTYNYPGDSITAVDVSASGRMAIVGTDAGNMAPIDLVRNTWLASLPSHRESVSGVRVIDGTAITSSWDGTARIYEFEK